MSVKLSASLPQDVDSNGMYVLHADLLKSPQRRHVVVLVVETATIKQVHDGQGMLRSEPTAGITHVEAIVDAEDADAILDIVSRTRAQRMNSDTLDFDFGVAQPSGPIAFDFRPGAAAGGEEA